MIWNAVLIHLKINNWLYIRNKRWNLLVKTWPNLTSVFRFFSFKTKKLLIIHVLFSRFRPLFIPPPRAPPLKGLLTCPVQSADDCLASAVKPARVRSVKHRFDLCPSVNIGPAKGRNYAGRSFRGKQITWEYEGFLHSVIFIDWMYCDRRGLENRGLSVCLCVCLSVCM